MEYRGIITIFGAFLLVNFALSTDEHAGTGSIVERDTDKISVLRGKLTELKNLLAMLEDGDEHDLTKVAEQNPAGQTPAKTAISFEDMGAGKPNKPVQPSSTAPSLQNGKKPADVHQILSQLSPEDRSSIEILAKALSRLKEPKYNNKDSTGDYLGTDNNESGADSAKTQEMEGMIARALAKLDQDKGNKLKTNPVISNRLQSSKGQDQLIRDEAIKLVESRLVEDVLFANRIGISVEDLIQDMDNKGQVFQDNKAQPYLNNKANKDDAVKEIEEELNAFNFNK